MNALHQLWLALRRMLGLGTVIRTESITRDGGRTFHSSEVDRQGRPVGPARTSFHDSETVPDGLAAVPGRVAGFFASQASSLTISSAGRRHCCGLLRRGSRLQMTLVFIDWRQHPEAELRVRDVFASEGILPNHDSRGEREAIVHYPLPGSAERIASLCTQVLAGLGVTRGEPLKFTVIRYA